jgi:hypothetical protein
MAGAGNRGSAGRRASIQALRDYNGILEVADDTGYSRRAGGIHNDEADYRFGTIGRQVAGVAWDRYFSPSTERGRVAPECRL